jgi:NADH:ubiquinone oxidoreductase subunit 5 (subunit L)/multisubunit Na+/H+ antiporter MnhA subunit
MLMTMGIIALAVPLSTTFAGEFLILAGIFQQGWGWAVVGAIAIVLAAMYALRLISGVLHQDVGPAVQGPDLRGPELAVLVPLVGLLLVLSAWPAAITDRAFAGNHPRRTVETQLGGQPALASFAANSAGQVSALSQRYCGNILARFVVGDDGLTVFCADGRTYHEGSTP